MTGVAIIDLPYIEKNKSRHGTMRYYLRIDGSRVCRLPDDAQSEEFAKAYWDARNKALPFSGAPQPISSMVKPNSFRWLCMEYMRTTEFTRLDATTQTRRRNLIESMWKEPLQAKKPEGPFFADMPLDRKSTRLNSSH